LQVLHHFLSNAVKFTPPRGRLTLRARRCGTDEFVVEVEDTGIGIAPQDIPKLFVEFQQLDLGTAKKYGGMGLGLASAKRLVEGMSGQVGVRREPGEGSTFFAVLPMLLREKPSPIRLALRAG
jgi:signal transduction histidine kinase